jgi:hypothetical protein
MSISAKKAEKEIATTSKAIPMTESKNQISKKVPAYKLATIEPTIAINNININY